MKKLIYLAFLCFYLPLSAQLNTAVYLIDFEDLNQENKQVNLKNISNKEGYNNQPSFYDDNTILYAATRNNQTDIARYNLKERTTSWITNTAIGSEYSPLKIPNQEAISAIRLDTNGLQRLYRIDIENGESKELVKNLVVGYHVWYNENILVSSVLVEDRMDLVVSNLKDQTNRTLEKNVGRSLHKIPKADLITFISKENKTWVLKQINPITGVSNKVIELPQNVNDICWLNDGTFLLPLDKSLLKYNPLRDKDWQKFHLFEEEEISGISRMSVSPNEKYLVMVSEKSPTPIIQKQVESFNKANLENFAACFSEEVAVQNFPKDTMYIGNAKLKKNYERFFAKNPKSEVTVLKRIVIGNKVIDEERVIVNGKIHHQAALYEVKNDKITSMTFIGPKADFIEAEKIVQQQLVAYNSKNLEDFANTFADTIKSYNYPNTLSFEGQDKLRTMFSDFFSKTPDLHCEIKNRIVIGNIVIDEEYITANGNNFSAVAIYEMKNDKIVTMTFVR